MIALLALLACGADEPPCAVGPDGAWTASGSCFGVAETLTVTFDPEACTATFADWATATGDEPTSADLADTGVTLRGGALDGCVGELRGDAIEGTCLDGCAFELGAVP